MKGVQPMTASPVMMTFSFGKVDEHVTLGVGAAEVEEMDLAVAPVKLHRLLEGDRRQRRLERLDLGKVRLGQAHAGLEPGALRGDAGRREIGPELGEAAGYTSLPCQWSQWKCVFTT